MLPFVYRPNVETIVSYYRVLRHIIQDTPGMGVWVVQAPLQLVYLYQIIDLSTLIAYNLM